MSITPVDGDLYGLTIHDANGVGIEIEISGAALYRLQLAAENLLEPDNNTPTVTYSRQ